MAAPKAASRHPSHNLANCRRGVLDRPSDFFITSTGVVDRGKLTGQRCIHRRPERMFSLVKCYHGMHVSSSRRASRGARAAAVAAGSSTSRAAA